MDSDAMKRRTRAFALQIIHLVLELPKSMPAEVMGRQLMKSGTSPGANYRAACRAKSTADFIYKLEIVEEELDESIYWIGLLVESGFLTKENTTELIREADELLSIVVASVRTTKQKKR
jgi:four helix bundle protein